MQLLHMYCFKRSPGVVLVATSFAALSFWAARGDDTPAAPLPVIPLNIQVATKSNELVLDTNAPLKVEATLFNTTDHEVSVDVEYLVQQEPIFYFEPPPHPLFGVDIARYAKSWTEENGHQIVESNDIYGRTNTQQLSINGMTDARPWTSFGTTWEACTEAFGYIDLGKTYHIDHMVYDPSDSSQGHKVDIDSSMDGKDYTPVEGMKGIDIHGRSDSIDFNVPTPFDARFIRIRLNNDGGPKPPAFRFPREFHIFGGIDDTTWNFPQVGTVIQQDKATASIGSKGSGTVTIGDSRPLKPGAYLVSIRTKAGGVTQMQYGHIFVMPPALAAISPQSRFGVDSGDDQSIAMLTRLGVGTIHYDNLFWSSLSPAAGVYKYEGSDKTLKAYHDAGMGVMAELYRTPAYLTDPKDKDQPDRAMPTDFDKYGEYVFQTVARYGSKKVSDGILTSDKTTGLGYVDAYELWDQPNHNNLEGGTRWKGTLDEYYKLFRIGAEAVKKADPDAKVANGGWWDLQIPLMETMRNFKYDDGKTPLDFTDILSLNSFSPLGDYGSAYGTEPELVSTYDISHHHEGSPYDRMMEQDLKNLVAWRDKYKPTMQIWFTQTGFDGGINGMNERLNACWIPRGIMTQLAAGVDKVQLFRDRKTMNDRAAPAGVLRDDGSLKPSWFTYATLIRQLDGVTGAAQRLPSDDPNARIYLWKNGEKSIVTAWTVNQNSTGKLGLTLGKCTLTDAFGGSQSVDVQPAQQLTEFPIYITDLDATVAKTVGDQAKAYAEKQQADTERIAKLRAYLFKFGRGESSRVKENDAILYFGTIRDFTLVSSEDAYDETKGWGFETARKGADQLQPWLQNPLTIALVSLPATPRFKFKAEPGTYTININTRGGKAITVGGLEGGDQVLQLIPGGITSAKVKVGSQPVTLSGTGGDAGLVWMSLLQVDDGAAAGDDAK